MSIPPEGRPSQPARARLLVVDVTAVCREGIRAIIARDSRFALCDDTSSGEGAAELLKRYHPDLLLLEPFGEGRDGVLLVKELAARFPKVRILAVSQRPEEVYAERILRAGASGYWMKSGTSEELIRSIETVLSGELYVSPRVAFLAVHKLVDAPRSRSSPIGGLTDRELHVYGLIGAGFGPGRIAVDLGLSRKTVEINLNKVESLQVDQGLLGRMLNFGTLVIAGTGTSHEPIVGISEPLEFRKAFISAQDAARRDA